MKLYHSTQKKNLPSILLKGLLPNKIGIVYLSPQPMLCFGDVILEVETKNNKLTAFDDCKKWEVLCWGNIPPEDLSEITVDK